jgi:hypothetical protein
MANDLFGNLGGIFGSIAKSVMPKDSPDGKLLSAQSDLSSLREQESDILLEIGRAAYEQNPSVWEQDGKLRLIRANIAEAQSVLDAAEAEKKAAEAAKKAASDALTCPNPECGHINPEGVKFCQECGTKLGAPAKTFCTTCGAELAPGTRFCGSCGAKQGE